MNHNRSKLDKHVDKLNDVFSFLLGKRKHKKLIEAQKQQTSTRTFDFAVSLKVGIKRLAE